MVYYLTANEAFTDLYQEIPRHGIDFGDTKAMFNVGFYLTNPTANDITHEARNFNIDYAEAEWQWYLSGDPNIEKLGELFGKVPQIWERMADPYGNVRSNYGWQWNREGQIDKIIEMLQEKPDTRQAVISIYDAKEIGSYTYDTPCTQGIHFQIVNDPVTGLDNLCMTVTMRSNDLWYGFCNDQYCFSKLQKYVADKVGAIPGWYYHFASNMHIYNDKLPG